MNSEYISTDAEAFFLDEPYDSFQITVHIGFYDYGFSRPPIYLALAT